MIGPSPRGSTVAHRRLAGLLLALFALQSGLRLVAMLPVVQRIRLDAAVVHALDLAALAGVAILVLRAAEGRRAWLVLPALAFAAVGILLTVFDVATLLAIEYRQRITTLIEMATFYCNADAIRACIAPHPAIAAALAAVWLGWAALIVVAGGALAAMSARALRPLTLAGRAPRLPLLLIASYLALWGMAWVARFPDMAAREPLIRFVTKNPLGTQPRALVTVARPDYRVAPTPGIAPRMLVLIVVDSLRADAVELAPGRPSRTPFLRSLAARGLLRDQGPAVAICPTSYCGITGILSSSDWATLEKGPPLTIADVLAANGYTSHYLLTGQHLRVLNLAALYGPNVATIRDDSSADSSGLVDDRDQVRRLAALHLADPRRSFLFVHLMSAHAGGLRFDRDAATPSLLGRLLGPGGRIGSYADYYDRGVRQADRIVAQLFAVLEARGLLDDALVVVTADHGERLSGGVGHGGGVDLATALVPLLVYDPRRDARPSPGAGMPSQVDVAPTLLAAAGIAVPRSWQGVPLQRGVTRPAAPSDASTETALVGRHDGRPVMVRCELATGRLVANGSAADPRSIAAGWGGWSGLARRPDPGRCPHG